MEGERERRKEEGGVKERMEGGKKNRLAPIFKNLSDCSH